MVVAFKFSNYWFVVGYGFIEPNSIENRDSEIYSQHEYNVKKCLRKRNKKLNT